jgi:hypothetical protein
MPTTTRQTFKILEIDGIQHDLMDFAVTNGWDEAIPRCTYGMPIWPANDAYYLPVVIEAMGATRFRGLQLAFDTRAWPRRVTGHAIGSLVRAKQYVMDTSDDPDDDFEGGLELHQILGLGDEAIDTTPLEEDLVRAVLNLVAARYADFTFDPADIAGNSRHLGTDNPEVYFWPDGMSALDYIHSKVDVASMGYRTYQTADGRVVRARIRGYPHASPHHFFTEGVDIFHASATGRRDVDDLANWYRVRGYVYGTNPVDGSVDQAAYTLKTANTFQSVDKPVVHSVDLPQVEHWTEDGGDDDSGRIAEGGYGYSAEEQAHFFEEERNHERATATWTVYSDARIYPGETIQLEALSRLHIGEKLWVKDVEYTGDGPVQRQRIVAVNGGLEGAYDVPPGEEA